MTEAHFERLSAMDLSFLAMEDGRVHMHIGSVSIFEIGPLRGEDGGIDFERILSFIEAQLHKVPRLRQRLEWVPGFEQPVWIDDARFNLRFHVRHTALPPPGDLRHLKRLAGRILSQEFDRGKPLWEYWFVDGLEGDRFAVIAKLHHCMADGMSSVSMGNMLVGRSPDYVPPPPRPWHPRPAPAGTRLVLEEMRHRVIAPFELLRAATQKSDAKPGETGAEAARTGKGQTGAQATKASGKGLLELLGSALEGGSKTPLNVEIGPHRRFDWTRLPLGEVREIGARAGATVNDVVLAVASGALRRFLRRRGTSVEALDFHAVVPVSVRKDTERADLGNRVSGLLARLPLDEADAWQRLLRVVETTHELKASGQAGAGDLLSQALDLLPTQLLGPLFQRAARSSAANLVITNVPGPREPVYLLGARQLASHPVVPLVSNQALGIALFSYDDGLYWGLNADWDAVPDLHDLANDIDESFHELAASGPAQSEAALPGREAGR